MRINIKLFTTSLILVLCICPPGFCNDNKVGSTIVEHYGLVHVKGSKIVDKNDQPLTLHGMSLFWSQWGGDFYNEDCVRWLRDDWKCTVVRAAMGVEMGGYLENPEDEYEKITTVIDACIELGIYVIVDWHDHNAQNHSSEAANFFARIAKLYGNQPNIIYEIYNEPLQVSWSDELKPYAIKVINAIRQFDPDNLIIVGTPKWSQDTEIAGKDPIADNNLAYTLHFYTSTHKQFLRDKAISAIDTSGIPLFITEFGISEANGDGIIDYKETETWLNFVDSYKLSTLNWSVFDKDETSSVLMPGADSDGEWDESDLSESGKFIRKRLRSLNSEIFELVSSSNLDSK